MLSTLAAQGQIVRTRTDEFDLRLIRQQQPEGSLPVSNFKFEREVRFHPESGKRSLIVRANTLEDLEALTRQVTGQ